MKILNTVIPILIISAVLPQIGELQAHKAARHQTLNDVINDVKLFPTVYPSI